MKPKKISARDGRLQITWQDGTITVVGLQYLRDECPCAGCKGETVLLKTYKPAERPPATEGTYQIATATMVGEYALQIGWKDGHDTGLYTWEYLKTLAEHEITGGSNDYGTLL